MLFFGGVGGGGEQGALWSEIGDFLKRWIHCMYFINQVLLFSLIYSMIYY